MIGIGWLQSTNPKMQRGDSESAGFMADCLIIDMYGAHIETDEKYSVNVFADSAFMGEKK
ncbi:MAG TPA: hypothetical protein PLM53_06020 [Spirochaetota bacterium]|nr:hypothetical protein [Spirochaetota bacterium]HPC39651.1 hypothetical protein [Spirochaetota bacterium]HPL19311.1 hypothetical protein [Spirochaetota bacterium]HQF07378.1 hypothetical protein [Spirochaetota bacterium]HQH96638.1 hypothetical protein [Spirochaetota bacterium]